MKTLTAILFILLTMVMSSSSQNLVPRAVEYDYPHLADYADSSIYFILYQKADPDTVFSAIDTSEVQSLEMDLVKKTWLYDFTWREFYVTAIQHEQSWPDSNWSFESNPSNVVREYFRALPPAGLDTTNGIAIKRINVGEIPGL